MSALLRRLCCCRNRGGGDGGCDPSKFPSSVVIDGTYSLACQSADVQIEYQAPGRFSLVATQSAPGSGSYVGTISHPIIITKHPYASTLPITINGRMSAGVSINGCGSGGFRYDNTPNDSPQNWPYRVIIDADFQNFNAQCGSCGVQNVASGLEWTALVGWQHGATAPAYYGNQCCGADVAGDGSCQCQFNDWCSQYGYQCRTCITDFLGSATLRAS